MPSEQAPTDNLPADERSAAAFLPGVLAENARLRADLLAAHNREYTNGERAELLQLRQTIATIHAAARNAINASPESVRAMLQYVQDATAPR